MVKARFLLLILLISFGSSAQKTINEATLTYEVSIRKNENGKDPYQLNGTYKVLLKGLMSRSDFTGSMGSESSIFNAKNGEGVVLKSFGSQKLMIKMTGKEWMSRYDSFRTLTFNFETETKVINGTTCKKAVSGTPDGDLVTVFYDPSVRLANKDFSLALDNIPGLPLQIQLQKKNIQFDYVMKSSSFEAVPATAFDYPQTGFRVMSYEEGKKIGRW